MLRMSHFLTLAALCLALPAMAGAAEAPWSGGSAVRPDSQRLTRDAQRALICETVTDWAAFQVTQLIRDDAQENQAVSPEGMQILRQIRLTEGLASAAFDKLAPQADHDSMYQDAVKRMQAYLHEDHAGADANTKRLVPACQQAYEQMAAAGELSQEQVQRAKDASQESVAKLTRELQGSSVPR